jgi:thiamine biosynthesis lipoprotein
MATRFEFVLQGASEVALRAAGEEAIAEILRVEAALSLYRADSEIATINREAATRPVRVSPEVFGLLRHALLLSRATGGAFDVTVGPLLRAWGLMCGTGHLPAATELEEARASVGADLVLLEEDGFTVRFARPGVMVDLGSIGKGYALDRAAEFLREAGVEAALLHGGTSTAVGWGRPAEADAWKVAIDPPPCREPDSNLAREVSPLAVVELREESLSVSAVWGKGFEADGRYYGHVLDPRRGAPVQGVLLAAMILPSATESDALSTALLVRGAEMVEVLRIGAAPARCLVVESWPGPPGYRVVASGISAIVS